MCSDQVQLRQCTNAIVKKYKVRVINLPTKTVKFSWRKSPGGRGYSTYQSWRTVICRKTLLIPSFKILSMISKEISSHVCAQAKVLS